MYSFSKDFENGSFADMANTTPAVTATALAAHDGTLGMRQQCDGVNAGIASLSDTILPDGYPYADVRCWFRQRAHTSGNSSVITVQNRAGSDHADLYVNYDADSRLWWDLLSTDNAKTDLVLNQWYFLRTVVFFGGTTWYQRVWLDDVEQAMIQTTGKTASDVRAIHFGGFSLTDLNTRDYDGLSVVLTDTDPTLPKSGRVMFADMETPPAPHGRVMFAEMELPGSAEGRVHYATFSSPAGSLATGRVSYAELRIPASPDQATPSGIKQLASNGAWWDAGLNQRTSNNEWA